MISHQTSDSVRRFACVCSLIGMTLVSNAAVGAQSHVSVPRMPPLLQ
jgi:hypothetical protein